MVWIKTNCAHLLDVDGVPYLPTDRRTKKTNVRAPATFHYMAAAIKRELLVYLGRERDHYHVCFELNQPGEEALIECEGLPGDRWWGSAAPIAEQQPDHTIRWFVRRHPNFERLQQLERDYEQGLERIARMREAQAEQQPERALRELAEQQRGLTDAEQIALYHETERRHEKDSEDERQDDLHVRGGLAALRLLERHQVPHGVRNHRAELSEAGRYEAEPEPEPEPMEPVWLQEAASSSACAAA